MKKLILIGIVLGMLAVGGNVYADMPKVWEYNVDVTTYAVKGSTENFAEGGYPNLGGNARIHKLFVSNDGDVDQKILIYKTATSTTAATLIWTIDLPGISDHNGIYETNWPYALPVIWTNFAIKKSSTGSNVSLYLNYR